MTVALLAGSLAIDDADNWFAGRALAMPDQLLTPQIEVRRKPESCFAVFLGRSTVRTKSSFASTSS
jgi:hypothetical protein